MLGTMTADEAIKHGCDVYPHVVGKAQPLDVSRWQLPPWAKWVAADADGIVYAYENCPTIYSDGVWRADGMSSRCCAISMAGIDWRRTLTPVNQSQPEPQADTIDAAPWCAQCNLPEDICRGHDVPAPASTDATAPAVQISIHAAALPGDVAETLFAQHSASWCERLIDELLTLLEAAKDSERHTRIWDMVTQYLQDDALTPRYDASLEAATFTPDTDCYFALSSAGAVE